MRSEILALPHPVDNLELNDCDYLNYHDEMFLVEGSTKTPYMPALKRVIDIIKKVREETLTNDERKISYRLTCAVNDQWVSFYERYHPSANVTFQGDTLVFCCAPQERQFRSAEVCRRMMGHASRDYCDERQKLRMIVFQNLRKQKWRKFAENEIQAERDKYQQKRHDAMLLTDNMGAAILNLNWQCRQILEVKFGWWRHVLDVPTIQQYRDLFEQDFRWA